MTETPAETLRRAAEKMRHWSPRFTEERVAARTLLADDWNDAATELEDSAGPLTPHQGAQVAAARAYLGEEPTR